jgi:GNAT superfamily N-acetyltransferase
MIVAYDGEEAVGMARLLHDGGFQAFIVDVVVMPEYQRMGIGKEMINSIIDYIYSHLDEGEIIYVGLMSAKGKEEFYEQFGFTQRPNDSLGSGMTQKIIRKSR